MKNSSDGSNILNITLPIIAQMTVYTFMSIFDLMIMGKFGGNMAVTVIGISNNLTNVFITIFISSGICIGMISFISRFLGARQYELAKRYCSIGFILGVAISFLLIFILFILKEKLLYMMGAREEVLKYSSNFLNINIVSLFFFMLSSVMNSILIAYENTMIPFIRALIEFALKIFFDFIFILNNPYKVMEGSALASFISYFTGFIFLFYYITFHMELNLFKLKKGFIKDAKNMMMLSIPSSFEEAGYSLSRFLCTSIIIHTGSIAFAADQIANTVETISITPGMAFGITATTLVGVNLGKKDYKKLKKVSYDSMFLATIIMCSFGIIFLNMSPILVKLFLSSQEREVAYWASKCLAIGAFEQPFIAISTVFAGALKGMGDTKGPFIISCITGWLIRLPLIYYFIKTLGYDVTYVWWITTFQWGIDAILMFLFFIYRVNNLK